jgi:hypothetical protein
VTFLLSFLRAGVEMLVTNLNEYSKEFLKKILLFIDATMMNSVSAKPEETDQILVTAMINIKDSIFSEIVKDNFAESVNQKIIESQESQKKEKEKNINLDQETGLEKDQS